MDAPPTRPSTGPRPVSPRGVAEARLERLVESTRRFRPEDRPALLGFQERLFGAQGRQLEEDRFRWLFTENPSADPAEPEIWLCEPGGIVGQQSGIVHRLRIEEEEFRASWAIDLMVDPAWRLRGVGPALAERHARSHPIVIALGATDLLYPVLLRTGWTDLGRVPTYLRPLRLEPLRPWWERRQPRLRRLASLASPMIRAADLWCDLVRLRAGVRLEPLAAIDERIDEVWRLAASDYEVLARRDAAALAWRFDRSPDARLYRRLLVLRGQNPVGYLVLREGKLLRVPVCFLVDFLCPRRLTAPLLALAVQAARRTPAAALVCGTLHRRAAGAFGRTGFFSVSQRTPKRFLWRTRPELSRLHGVLSDRTAWFVTRADADWDHPNVDPESFD